jgi:hypothetical protein
MMEHKFIQMGTRREPEAVASVSILAGNDGLIVDIPYVSKRVAQFVVNLDRLAFGILRRCCGCLAS